MKIKILAIGALIAGLTGCVSNSAPHAEDESIVGMKAQIGDEMIARLIDSKPVGNLKYFTFKGAEHTLEVGIVMVGQRDNHRRCLATLSYAHFEPGAHYTLTQKNIAMGDIAVSLIDSDGKVLARAEDIPCV